MTKLPRRFSVALCLGLSLTGLSACTQFPALDAVPDGAVDRAGYPDLVPLESLLVGREARATPQAIASVEGRVAALRLRAARLQRLSAGPAPLTERAARLRQKATALRAPP
ncbi:MAG: hypothetical protein N4A53_01265 [Pelagimonas sp.]|jgi:hypothetical protein|nr:hypothetical protein [Pelagimonas sp.]